MGFLVLDLISISQTGERKDMKRYCLGSPWHVLTGRSLNTITLLKASQGRKTCATSLSGSQESSTRDPLTPQSTVTVEGILLLKHVNKKLDQKQGSHYSSQHFDMGCQCHNHQLNQLYHNPGPKKINLKPPNLKGLF